MSSLTGVFNASSTLFTMDLYQKFRPRASQHQLVWMGRIATAVMVLIGLAWIPVIQGGRGLYYYLQSRRSWNWVDVTASVVLGAAILWAYLYFNG